MSKLTHWLEKYIIVGWLLIGFVFAIAAYWAMDRDPPFHMGSYTVFNAARGNTLFVNADVQRDISRGCTATFSRYIFDSKRVRHDLGGGAYMGAAGIAAMEHDAPGQLRIAVIVPPGAAIGRAQLITSIEYQCNPVHALWPIEVLLRMDIEVLP